MKGERHQNNSNDRSEEGEEKNFFRKIFKNLSRGEKIADSTTGKIFKNKQTYFNTVLRRLVARIRSSLLLKIQW